MTDFDPILNIDIEMESVPPDKFFKYLEERSLKVGMYDGTMGRVSVHCPASLVFEIEQHRDVLRVIIATAPFMIKKMKEQMEN